MSWIAEVLVAGETKWHSNDLHFDTKAEAEHYAEDLAWRWTSVNEWRVSQTTAAVNYVWKDGRAKSIKGEGDGGPD